MSRSSTAPKGLLRILAHVAVFGALIFLTLWVSDPAPPPVTRDWQATDHTVPNATIFPHTRSASKTADVFHDTLWPQFVDWRKDSWVFSPPEPPNVGIFARSLQTYTGMGHNHEELRAIASKNKNVINTADDLTVIIDFQRKEDGEAQMEALIHQTMRVHTVWLICDPELEHAAEEFAIRYRDIVVRVVRSRQTATGDYPKGSAGASRWLSSASLSLIETEWVWILESGVVPTSSEYIAFMTGLVESEEYADTLLGTHATLLSSNFRDGGEVEDIICFPDVDRVVPSVTQPVDMVHGSWWLRKSWLLSLLTTAYVRPDELSAPLPFYISYMLRKYGNIPSLVLPDHADYSLRMDSSKTCQSIYSALKSHDANWSGLLALRTSPSALDYRQTTVRKAKERLDTVLFVVDGPEQAVAFHPLMCRYHYTVHAAVTGKNRGLSGATFASLLKKTGCFQRVIVHDIDVSLSDDHASIFEITHEVSQLLQVLQPSALIYIRAGQSMSLALKAAANGQNRVAIGLPAAEVRHALWIADLPVESLKHWNTPDITLIVITDRRPHSLSRLLRSTEKAYYLGDDVDIVVNLEQSSDKATRMLVNDFGWSHGKKRLRHRIRKGGLMPAIVESWYPHSNHHYAVLLEDDVEVSPLFYVWAKYSILRYRYSGGNTELSKAMYGISLYSPRNVELHPAGRRPFHPDNVLLNLYPPRMPYLSQIPCSWGAVYFPEHWREFHEYLTARLMDEQQNNLLNITVPNSRSVRWKKSWKKYFIELVYLRAYVMLYPNFQSFESFSTNHLETGTHVKSTEKRNNAISSFLVPLMHRDTILDQLPQHRLPDYADLPVLDLWGNLVSHEILDETASRWHGAVSSCPRSTGQYDPKDILCPFPESRSATVDNETTATKKNKKPVTKYAVEPIQYVTTMTDFGLTSPGAIVVEDDHDDLLLPQPIDVAVMPTDPDEKSVFILDDEKEDFQDDLQNLISLYQPVDLEDILAADAEMALED